jgi:peptide/nickel transport system substrate-binding protein
MESGYWERITRQRMARRRLLKAGASISLGGAALALVGCGDDDDDGDGGGGEVPEGAGGGTVNIGLTSDLTGLEPHVTITDHTDSIWQIWERLTEYDSDLEPQGKLAESWEVNDDSTEFVFHLRENATWHTGRDFTSDDVNYNMLRVRDEAASFSLYKAQSEWYEDIEMPDDNTIVFRSSIPRPLTFDFIDWFNMGDQETLDDKTKAIGTGAYMLGEWRPGDQFNLLKNPTYWEEGRPLLDEQIFRVSLDPQTMVQQFETGALDIAKTPPLRDFVRWRDSDDYGTLVHGSPGSYYAFGFNTTWEPLADKRVRHALQWTVDRERFGSAVLLDTAQTFSLPWPEASLAYEEDKRNFFKRDLDKARELLDEAGVETIEGFTMLLVTDSPEHQELAEIWQADLDEIGISAEIELAEVADFVERINADPPNYNGVWMSASGRANAGAPITHFVTVSVLWATNGDNNTGFQSPEYTRLIDTILLESDRDVLKDLYSELNDLLLEESFIGFLGSLDPRVAYQNKVKNIGYFAGLPGFRYQDTYVEA